MTKSTVAKSTVDDLQSGDSKILYVLLSEKIENLEENIRDDMQALANDLSSVKDDVNTIASVFGFIRDRDGKLYRPT